MLTRSQLHLPSVRTLSVKAETTNITYAPIQFITHSVLIPALSPHYRITPCLNHLLFRINALLAFYLAQDGHT